MLLLRANTIVRAGLTLLLMSGVGLTIAAEQRYDYDPLGRLIRSVTPSGSQVDYVYDAAGNLLQVTSGAIQAPSISTSDLGSFRRNEFRTATILGANLVGTSLRGSHPGISISNIVSSATSIQFIVSVAQDTPLGPHQLIVESAAGSATVGMTVLEGALITIDPQPIVVPPDNLARKYYVRLPDPAVQSVTLSLSTHSPTIAKTNMATVTIPAGQTTAEIGVIGVSAGTTVLSMSSSNWINPVEALVSVSSGTGNQIIYSARIGITRGAPWASESLRYTVSKTVGITRGVPWANIENRNLVSNLVGITRGESWLSPSDKFTASSPVGIERGGPFAKSLDILVVTPPVGVTRP